jgi:hypothetical protein
MFYIFTVYNIGEMEEENLMAKGLDQLVLDLHHDFVFHQVSDETKVLVSNMKQHENVDALVAESLNNLAACHESLGELDEAHQLYTEALQIRKVIFGDHGVPTAESRVWKYCKMY